MKCDFGKNDKVRHTEGRILTLQLWWKEGRREGRAYSEGENQGYLTGPIPCPGFPLHSSLGLFPLILHIWLFHFCVLSLSWTRRTYSRSNSKASLNFAARKRAHCGGAV